MATDRESDARSPLSGLLNVGEIQPAVIRSATCSMCRDCVPSFEGRYRRQRRRAKGEEAPTATPAFSMPS